MLPTDLLLRGLVHEEPGGLDLGVPVRELVLDRLEVADRLVELLALMAVFGCRVQCGVGNTDSGCGDGNSKITAHDPLIG